MNSEQRLIGVIGAGPLAVLKEHSVDPSLLTSVASLVFNYHTRSQDFDLRKNMLVNLVKVVVQSKEYRKAAISGEAQQLVKALGIEEAERQSIYEALFDKSGIYKPTALIQIYR